MTDYRRCARKGLLLSLFLMSSVHTTIQRTSPSCDRTFVSLRDPKNGTFRAPNIVNTELESKVCVYTFMAGLHQKVYVSFTSFQLRSIPPECLHEYVDVYTEVELGKNNKDLVDSPFDGRYCGESPPKDRMSLYRTLGFSFYTDKNTTSSALFEGHYYFVDESMYQFETAKRNSLCSFIFHSNKNEQGIIVTPTYPAIYPLGLQCTYLFLGQPGQRLQLEFNDFDITSGGQHCPFDVVSIYDGNDTSSPLIEKYCGQHRNLVVYSTEEQLYMTFDTLERATNPQRRGFKAKFKFSQDFVTLDFIEKKDGEHIRGTECDQKVLSKKASSGYIYSPNYPLPYMKNVVCRYFIYGIESLQDLEIVKLEFLSLHIPKTDQTDQSCTDGYLRLYLKGQEEKNKYDLFDHEICGEQTYNKVFQSDGPRLALVFSSENIEGRGFKAKFTFIPEYLVPGTPATDSSCHYSYRSSCIKQGYFNSPRHPYYYPNGLDCTFIFYLSSDEQITLIFDHFKIKTTKSNTSIAQYGVTVCTEDWLEIYTVHENNVDQFMGRYCGRTTPGPLESDLGAVGLKVLMHTDSKGVYTGFKARYFFKDAKPIIGDCGSKISYLHSGKILSPKFPKRINSLPKGMITMTCNWFINVRPDHKVLFNFNSFAVEGNPLTKGCGIAVVKIWSSAGNPPLELCGKKLTDSWQFLSHSNQLNISFTVAGKSDMGSIFYANWNEVTERGGKIHKVVENIPSLGSRTYLMDTKQTQHWLFWLQIVILYIKAIWQ
ncbi:cubilin-like isoform X2 [Adelges cooleyi]|uniref:cubilin-like isoform X2 n=1 Tax=Adelges cooleyi TaxID=133065 RepID=UPI00217F46AB|nr:cubilin-like isoform X2 [Adelges cooleyi]